MKPENLLVLAEEIGFSHYGLLDPDALIFRDEIRQMCTADKCHNFGRSWSCPPSPVCGTPAENALKAKAYPSGILVQMTGQMEDPFDSDTIRETERLQKKNFDTLVRQVRLIIAQEGGKCLPMGSGGCTRCHKCTYPDAPCRFPDRLYPSMEACGLWVSDVCERSGMKYNYGENTITFTACILIREA